MKIIAQVKILFNILARGVAILLSSRFYSMYWPEGVAVLIPHEDKFKLRSYSLYWHILARGGGSFDPS